MSPAQQWRQILAGLPETWGDVRLALNLADDAALRRAAELLAPLQPTRAGREMRFYASRIGTAASPAAVERALARVDEEGIRGELRVLATNETTVVPPAASRETLIEQWDAAVETLPEDWSDVYAEIELTSSDHLDPAALALAPLNPSAFGRTPGFRFRGARHFGYGASPEMVRRCLTRLDERGIPGRVRILRVLSDTKPVGTQGPVWYVGGKVV